MFDNIALFTKLVELNSFSKTSEKLNIPPSTLSRRIKELEIYLNAKLIIRDTRNMNLTEHGQLLYSKFKNLHYDLEQVYNTVNSLKDNDSGELNLSLPLQMSFNLITPFLNYFSNNHPNVKINCSFQVTEDNIDKYTPDILITYQSLSHKDYIRRLIRKEYAQLYCTPDYIKKYGAPITPYELENHNFLGLIDPISKKIVNQIQFTHLNTKEPYIFDCAKHSKLRLNTFHQVLQLGLCGEHIFGGWNHMCDELEQSGKLVKVLPNYYGYELEFYLYSRKNIRKIENDFIDFIQRCMNGNIKQDVITNL